MVQITIAPGKKLTPLTYDERNGVTVTLGCYVMIANDPEGKPVGIKAVGQGHTVDVALDRVQLKAFAEQILRALH